ncbi:hypothetical protein SNEBB_011339 [Seison nebaliae]|nr:hypothetical protein SNEBB_011339 [Seison nebaliae]
MNPLRNKTTTTLFENLLISVPKTVFGRIQIDRTTCRNRSFSYITEGIEKFTFVKPCDQFYWKLPKQLTKYYNTFNFYEKKDNIERPNVLLGNVRLPNPDARINDVMATVSHGDVVVLELVDVRAYLRIIKEINKDYFPSIVKFADIDEISNLSQKPTLRRELLLREQDEKYLKTQNFDLDAGIYRKKHHTPVKKVDLPEKDDFTPERIRPSYGKDIELEMEKKQRLWKEKIKRYNKQGMSSQPPTPKTSDKIDYKFKFVIQKEAGGSIMNNVHVFPSIATLHDLYRHVVELGLVYNDFDIYQMDEIINDNQVPLYKSFLSPKSLLRVIPRKRKKQFNGNE